MSDAFQVNGTDEYLPLRDVVFNTLRQAILTGEMKRAGTGRTSDGDSSGK